MVLLPLGLSMSACVSDDTTDVPMDLADISVLKFVERASFFNVDVEYDIDPAVAEDHLRAGPAGDVIRMAAGMAAGDVNRDGWTDVLLLRGDREAQLFYNIEGVFLEGTEQRELETGELAVSPVFADLDGDGWQDLLLAGVGEQPVQLFKNDKGTRFEDVTERAGLSDLPTTLGFALGDVDGDQDLDLLALRYGQVFVEDAERPSSLWLNDGDARFEASDAIQPPLVEVPDYVSLPGESPAAGEGDAGAPDGGATDAGADVEGARLLEASTMGHFADLDDDGDADLLLVQDFAGGHAFENRGSREFRELTSDDLAPGPAKGAAVGDYDNDGDLDWFVSGVSADRADAFEDFDGNRLYRNDGDGQFEDVSRDAQIERGSYAFGACFADFNNDSLLDIFQVNGWGFLNPDVEDDAEEFLDDAARLFMQDSRSPGEFNDLAEEARIDDTGEGRGVICFDFDKDGDIDVLIQNAAGSTRLYENQLDPEQGSGANWLSVRLVAPTPNRDAIGARVYVTAEGITQMRELGSERTFGAQGSTVAHFGLRNVFEIDELRVVWPDGVEDTVVEGVRTNQALVLRR